MAVATDVTRSASRDMVKLTRGASRDARMIERAVPSRMRTLGRDVLKLGKTLEKDAAKAVRHPLSFLHDLFGRLFAPFKAIAKRLAEFKPFAFPMRILAGARRAASHAFGSLKAAFHL